MRRLTAAEWNQLLEATDREHLTLALGVRCGTDLPEWVRARIASNLVSNAERLRRIRQTYSEIAETLHGKGIEFAVLKGFSHSWGFVADAAHRPQGDLDLLCAPEDVYRARDVLTSLGYEPLRGFADVPLDHLPLMIRKTGWRWRGDYFDPGIPLGVEVHFRLWDSETERIELQGIEVFSHRRTLRYIGDVTFPALDPVDTIAYAAMHLIRHLLRGDVRLYHAYEVAHFLESTVDHGEFWRRWQDAHSPSVRAIQAIAFRLSMEWFGCRIADPVFDEMQKLPEPVRRWFDLFAMAPVQAKLRPNKNELWLHLALLHSAADRLPVARRRLLPLLIHRTNYDAHVPATQATWRIQVRRALFQCHYTFRRAAHHAGSTLPTLLGGVRWWWAGKGLQPGLLVFLGAAALFNLGMSIFFLLYNLLLLQRGFHEDFLGLVSSAMNIGGIAGTIPAGLILGRFGLRATIVASFIGVSLVCVVRAMASTEPVLIGSAFAGGFLFPLYAVALAPAVAQLTTERSRPFGFSLVFSFGIGIGVVAGLVGGQLPALLGGARHAATLRLQPALLIACGIAILGAVPALGLPAMQPQSESRIYPRSQFMRRFLIAMLIWSFATGAFNPFFNAYFSQVLRLPVSRIGTMFSAAQLVQVIAVLAAPLALRRLGVRSGVMSMQFATAAMLMLFALQPPGFLAMAVYAGYMGFQYMSEPGIYSLLMDSVDISERSGASALIFLVMSSVQAVSATASGFGVRRFGYATVLVAASVIAFAAGFAFRALPQTQFAARSKIASTS